MPLQMEDLMKFRLQSLLALKEIFLWGLRDKRGRKNGKIEKSIKQKDSEIKERETKK